MYNTNKLEENLYEFMEEYKTFDSVEEIDINPTTFKTFLNDELVGYLVFTEEIGYQSKIKVATHINEDGYVLDVKTFDQNETPAFYKRLEDNYYFNKFSGKNIVDGFEVGENIDAISRATISSQAVAKAVHEAAVHVGRRIDMPVQNRYAKVDFGATEIAVILLIIATTIAVITKSKRMRLIVLYYSVIVIGFKFSMFISYSFIFSAVTGQLPTIQTALNRFLMLFGVLGLILFTGKNVYCAYMCPFGAIQELTFKTAKLHIVTVDRRVTKIFKILPGILAYTAFVLVALTNQTGGLSYEPFSLVFGFIGADALWILLPVILLSSLFVLRYYCLVGCPIGFILNGITKLRNRVVRKWLKN